LSPPPPWSISDSRRSNGTRAPQRLFRFFSLNPWTSLFFPSVVSPFFFMLPSPTLRERDGKGRAPECHSFSQGAPRFMFTTWLQSPPPFFGFDAPMRPCNKEETYPDLGSFFSSWMRQTSFLSNNTPPPPLLVNEQSRFIITPFFSLGTEVSYMFRHVLTNSQRASTK